MKRYIIVAAILVLSTLILIALTSCSMNYSETTDAQTKTLKDFDELAIDLTSGNTVLHIEDNIENHIDYKIVKSGFCLFEPNVIVENSENKALITSKGPWFTLGTVKISIDIFINKHDFQKLSVEMTSGNFTADDYLKLTELDVDITSGDVLISNADAEKCDIETTSGTVSAKGNFNSADVKMTSGNVYVKSKHMPSALSAKVTSGNAEFTFPDSKQGFTIDYDMTSGNINSDFETKGFSGKEGTVTHGDGKAKFDFDLTSGNISLKDSSLS